VAVRGRGQQQANNKSIFRKAIILSNVGAVFMLCGKPSHYFYKCVFFFGYYSCVFFTILWRIV